MLFYLLLSHVACLGQDGNPNRKTRPFDFDPGKVFDEVTQIVRQEFYDADFDFDTWSTKARSWRAQALAADSPYEFDRVMNRLLAELKTSHTYYYSKRNPRCYQLFGIFHQAFEHLDPQQLCLYEGIGIDTQFHQKSRGWEVLSVFEGLPAEQAGIEVGDVILNANQAPFYPVESFTGKAGQKVKLTIQRNKTRVLKIGVSVEGLDGRSLFETTLSNSVRKFSFRGKQIGYVHVRSYAGTRYQDMLRNILLFGELKDCDGLVLDLRDGWGGADLNYLNLFRPPIARVTSQSRRGRPGSYSGVWEKPVTLLTNGRSTSGKELFAYGFKKLKLGKIVGEKTAGAVVGGRCFPLSNGDALYLAVVDVHVDGVRLEGVGVSPDLPVQADYQEKKQSLVNDAQLNAAIVQCHKEIASREE